MMKRMLTRLLALPLSVLLVGGVFVACKNPPRDESKTTESSDLPPEDLPDYFDGKPYRIDYLKDVPGTGYCTACLVFNPNWTAEDFTVEIPEKSPAGDTVTHFKGGYHFCENYGVPAVISEKTYQKMIMTPLKEAGERGELGESKEENEFYIYKFDSYFFPKDPMAIEAEDEKEACIKSYPITDPNGANIPIRVFASDAAYLEILKIQEYLKKYTSFTKETIQSEYRYFRDEIRKLNPDDAKRDKMLKEFQFAMGDRFVDLVLPKTIVEMDPIELRGYEKLLQHENGITYAGNCAIFADSELTTATLRAGTVCIASGAFSGCEKLISVTIPDSVTSIGNSAFHGCVSLVNITIPDSVMSIGKEAFYNCDGLIEKEGGCSYVGNWIINCENDDNLIIRKGTIGIGHSAFYGHFLLSLTLPESIKYIGPYAFYELYYSDNLSIPDGVLSIDASAFQKFRGLTGITVGKNNKKYHSDGNCLIITDSKTLILGCNYSIIPSDGSVVAIGPYAFSNCDNLKNVTIPEGVTSIGEGAFLRCGSLSSIAIPDGITKINNWVFSECANLTSVLLPDSVTEIGDNGFSSCFILEEITIPKNVKRIGNSAFLAAGLKKIVIPNGVVYIGKMAFCFCRNLVHVTIPDSVTSIGDEAFSECNLLSIDVGEGNQAYRSEGNCLINVNKKSLIFGCKSLVSITIPDSVTNIEDEAFVRCKDLVSIIIPDSVVNIGRSAFSECSSLMSVTLGNGVKSIDDSAFSGCGSLTSIVIPDSVTSIGEHAFYGCSGLANLTIGSSVTDIGLCAFKECINLVSVTIPGSVTHMGPLVFFRCSNLTSIHYTGTRAQWNAILTEGIWDKNAGPYIVHCTDGDISKN